MGDHLFRPDKVHQLVPLTANLGFLAASFKVVFSLLVFLATLVAEEHRQCAGEKQRAPADRTCVNRNAETSEHRAAGGRSPFPQDSH